MLELKDIVVSFKKEVQKKIFGTERKTVLHGISLAVRKGESLGILGESGSGKSTTGRVLAGLLKPDSGAVLIEGEDVYAGSKGREHLRNRLSVVFQDYTTSANPRFTIRQVIGEGIAVGARKTGEKIDYAEETARLLRLVGLDESFAKRFPHELSGGQLQRVCIARAIACRSKLILFDEAVSSLDAHTQVQIMDLLLDLKEKTQSDLYFHHARPHLDHLLLQPRHLPQGRQCCRGFARQRAVETRRALRKRIARCGT